MHVERFFVPGLAHASYAIVSADEAIIIDPERCISGYLDYLAKNRLHPGAIILTHPHADFIAGHTELSSQSGAPILISEKAPAVFVHQDLREGDRIQVGTTEVLVIDTPGHSPDSICLCVSEAGSPVALFSGDTLFAGDVGRPDLRDREIGSHELAEMLYESLFEKLLKLPPDVKVYPAHGAGSLCGRQISTAPFTTIGQERATNWALQLNDRDQFIDAMVANLPDRPPYFSRSVTINLRGAPLFADLATLVPLHTEEFNQLRQTEVTILDVRPAALYGEAHVASSLNIGIASPSFAVWCGFFINPELPIVLVTVYEPDARRAQIELARIGFDEVAGFIAADDLDETLQTTQIGARDLVASLKGPQPPVILDVRSHQEWNQDHLEGTINIPLPQLLRNIGRISRTSPLSVLCGSGYRSSIATSLLESEGFKRLSNVMGGMHSVRHATRASLPAIELAENALTWEI
jgi:hydroxyacylglutathione hydrolase